MGMPLHNIHIEQTHDMEIVGLILNNPSILPHITDDGPTAPPSDAVGLYWLLVKDGDEILGLYLLHPVNFITYEMHTCLLPLSWGRRALIATRVLGRWMFFKTGCRKIITHVPSNNRLAYKYAIRGGMKEEGILKDSYLKDGNLLDLHILGITKEEWICQQSQQ